MKSYGHADLEFDVKLPTDASFEIGSVTKQFTSAAILQLVEQGKLSLDDDITKYVDFNTQGTKVTIRNLLTHTSGIKGYTELASFPGLSKNKYSRDTLLQIVEKEPFDFAPGEALIYSNTGFFILGLIIEKLTGLTYEAYVTENLFRKAGMSNSYYCSESKVIRNRAHGYDAGGNGALLRAAYLDHTWPYAAGSLCSTLEDLGQWNIALHNGGILGEKMYQEFISPATLNDGTITHYAKGVSVTDRHGRRLIEHGGGINGFLSQNCYFPEEKVSIIVLINTMGPIRPRDVADRISEFIFGESPDSERRFTGDPSKYVGHYKGRGRGQLLSVRVQTNEAALEVQIGDNPKKPLTYVEKEVWSDGFSTCLFSGNEDAVQELRIDQVYGYYILKRDK